MTSFFDCRPFDLPIAYRGVFTDAMSEESNEAMLHMPPVKLIRATEASAGLDITYTPNQPGYILFPSLGFPRLALLPTGIYWKGDRPKGLYARLQMRSSAWKDGCFALHPGLIDYDYKGQIYLGLSYLCTNTDHTFYPKCVAGVAPTYVAHRFPEKPFAQIVLEWQPDFCFRDDVLATRTRGEGGFGSTNVPQTTAVVEEDEQQQDPTTVLSLNQTLPQSAKRQRRRQNDHQ
jgi:dUTPase